MKVSVVVPTFNRRDVLLRTLESLFRQNFPASDFEIVVVIDGSNDGTAAAVAHLASPPCPLRVIEQENQGLPAARNRGWRAASNELVIFLDDDMVCEQVLVEEHCAAHRRYGHPLVAVGAIFLTDDSPPTLAAECFKREIGALSLRSSSRQEAVPRIFGNTSVRREMLEKAGGFDERFRVREDAELSARMVGAGAVFKFLPKAIARQYYFKTNADLLSDAEQFATADLLLVREHPELASTTLLGKLAAESRWKQSMRRMMLSFPSTFEALLGGVCRAAESFEAEQIRELGVRALQARRVLRYSRRARELSN